MMLATIMGCENREASTSGENRSENYPRPISDAAAFEQLLATAGDRLLVIDFHAEWCAPCKLLVPILAEVSRKTSDLADFYAVDIDANRALAQRMGVSGIPYVLLMQNGTPLKKLRGLLSEEIYIAAIREAAAAPAD
ncbi:MAG: thioredoxin family protein [Desulfosarcinaceae bacterium]|nr:thioredoxin family protein [Desulfosarcinaceae bacterium]